MARIYVITSGKGGVGKTTSAINLGAALNQLGEDTIVVDANLTTPNVGLHLGAPIVPVTLNHVLSGESDVADAIYEHSSGLKVLPSSLSLKELRKLNYQNLQDIAKQLKKLADHIILDSSAGLGREAESAISSGDEIIIITQAEMPAVTDALKTAKLAESLNKQVRGFILTRYKARRAEMPLTNISEMLEVPLLGIIPEDKNVQKSLMLKDAVFHTHPRSKASRAYKKLAERLLGSKYAKQQEQEEKSFWRKIFG